jgi:hypothetical protein
VEYASAIKASDSGGSVLAGLVNWLMRGLMAIAGLVLVYQGLPVAQSALLAQKADSVVEKLRTSNAMTLSAVIAGMDALSDAVAANPVADRYLLRSELEGGAALTPDLNASNQQVKGWMLAARSDLEIGLAAAPARSVDWLRLAAMHEALDGPSREVVALLDMSIKTGPWISPVWPTRLRLILDNWAYYTDEQKAGVKAYVSAMWRDEHEQYMFGQVVHGPVDELILRSLLRDELGAQEGLSRWILPYQKK